MKIAQIAPPWFTVPPRGYGGTERVVGTLTDALVARGHDVTLYASGGSRSSARVISPLAHPPDPRDLGNPADDLFHAYSALTDAEDFDVVHDHSGFAGATLAAMRGQSPPLVHTLHGQWTPASRRLFGRLGDSVNLVAISRAQQQLNVAVRYVGIVHNGIDPARFPFRSHKEDVLAFLGRATPDKGPVEAIELARACGRRLVMMIKFNEPEEITYWHEVIEPHLRDDIEVIRNADFEQKVAVLGRAAALVSPIRWDEPFGLVMVEAMACGTPVIATALGSVPEVVVDGVTGIHLDPIDPVASGVEAMRHLDAIDPSACRRRVEELFSVERMADGYLDVYERVLATGHPSVSVRGSDVSNPPHLHLVPPPETR